ncbi:putative aldouronate transport system substrate-binding protein [Evansella caseinilytica]|uniref:Putative aldouronate transport system substrate-binding protein n=1 Tax=Evansella caseinilytica TaxID=1503961 RepID=A0A1H3U4V2_9BACI|nr:ABC transporter substrate-binding protein [Evansella caseinilytica]SDZ57111.1 putative aldouronate transport system substrate-binding protein [Evansella caseinilytica]
MKKTILLLAMLLGMVGLLIACGGEEAGEGKSETTENEGGTGDTGEVGEKLDPVTLTWYLIGTPQQDLELVMEEVNKYTEEKINATIDLRLLDWGEFDERMQVITTSGENYDIAFTSSWANNYALNARRGAFAELNELMDQYGKEMKELIDPAFLEGAQIDGKLYAVPTNKEVGQQAVLSFNHELVEKHDLDISTVNSLTDLEPLLAVIKEKETDVTPIATFDAYLPFDSILQEEMPFAFRLDGNTDEVVNKYEEEVTMETLKVMHDYYKKGYIRPDAATSTDSWPLETPNWFVRKELYQPYAESVWSRSAGYEIVTRPLHEPYVFNNSVTGSMQAISTTSQNPERAMMFLNLLNTDPYLRNLIDKGIEGVHYEENADGSITDLPVRVERYNMPSFAIGNQLILKLYEDDPADKWEAFEEFNEKSIPSPALGFYFDSNPVRTEIAAISNVTSEFSPALLKGAVDPEEFIPEFNKKLYEAGMQDVLDEIQRQYDEWKENQ